MQQVPMTDVVKSTQVKLSLQNANISIRSSSNIAKCYYYEQNVNRMLQ